MADPQDAYQRSIDQAAKIYANASESYNGIKAQLDALSANATDISAGGSKEAQYAALTKQLQTAQARFNDAEQAYQSAIELQDKAKAAAKEVYPAGQTRTRLDTTAGNVLVSVTETADGRGGWNVDTNSVKRVQVAGSQAAGTRIAAPTSDKYIVTLNDDGTLTQKDNPNFQPDKSAGPQAVPASEFVWNPQTGKVESNTAYRPSAPIVNTEAPQIPDPANPGKFMPNPNYRAPSAQVNTTAEYIDDPAHPGSFIRNPNYKSPDQQLTTGQRAADTATAGTATDIASSNLAKAQADARTAKATADDAERKGRQSPTDQQAQQAIATAQRGLELANQQLENAIAQSKDLNPVAVEQARATLEQTRANTQKGLQGDLYGRSEQIRQIKALVQSGDVSPTEGDLMVNALNRGTSVYQAQVQQQSDRTAGRGQDLSNKNALAGNFTSALTSGFSTLADMNKYATKGSTAGADAFLALLNIAQDRLKSYELPPAQATDYLSGGGSNVSGLIGAAQQVTQQPVPQPVVQQPQPVAAPAGGTAGINITINQPHPADQAQGALQSAYQPETAVQSAARNNVGGLVSTAAQKVPASEEDVWNAYGVKPPTGAGVM